MIPSEKNIKRAIPSPISNPTAFLRKNIALPENKLRAYKSIFRLIKISLHKYRNKSEKHSQEIAKIIEIKKPEAGLFPLKILQTILEKIDQDDELESSDKLIEASFENNSASEHWDAEIRLACLIILGNGIATLKPLQNFLETLEETSADEGYLDDIITSIIVIDELHRLTSKNQITTKPIALSEKLKLAIVERNKFLIAFGIDNQFPRDKQDQKTLRKYFLSTAIAIIGEINERTCDLNSNTNFNNSTAADKNFYIHENLWSNYFYENLHNLDNHEKLENALIREMAIKRIIISYPKSGRTWLRQILNDIDKSKSAQFTHLMANPYFWTSRSDDFIFPEFKDDLVVFLHRDPRDVVVSQFHQIHLRDIPHKNSSEHKDKFSFMMTDFVTKESPPPKDLAHFIYSKDWGIERIFRFNLGALANCNIDYIWNYEMMLSAPCTTTHDFCKALKIKAQRSQINAAVSMHTFEKMSEAECSGIQDSGRTGALFKGHDVSNVNARKARRGIAGGWKDEVNESEHFNLTKLTAEYYKSALTSTSKFLFIPDDIRSILKSEIM